MFGLIGAPELIVILLIALLIFGPRKLPQLGRTLGRSLGEFRQATQDLKSTLEREVSEEENRPIAHPPAAGNQVKPDESDGTPVAGRKQDEGNGAGSE